MKTYRVIRVWVILGLATICVSCVTKSVYRPLDWEFEGRGDLRIKGVGNYDEDDQANNFHQRVAEEKLSGKLTVRQGGKVVAVSDYKDGQRVSVVSYYPSGTVRERAHFSNGFIDGERCQYWENGQIAVQEVFRAGEPDGPYRAWAPSGKRTHEGMYVNGLRQGIWHLWSNEETAMRKEVWDKGELKDSVRILDGAVH